MKQQNECGCGCQGVDRRGALARLFYGALGLVGLSSLVGCPGGSSYGREDGKTANATKGKSRLDHLEFDKRECRIGESLELDLNGAKIVVANNRNRDENPKWIAVNRQCTHNRCLVSYDNQTNEFVCPCHGSRFSFSGEPLSGPARKPLKTYRIEEGPVNVSVYEDPAQD